MFHLHLDQEVEQLRPRETRMYQLREHPVISSQPSLLLRLPRRQPAKYHTGRIRAVQSFNILEGQHHSEPVRPSREPVLERYGQQRLRQDKPQRQECCPVQE